MNSDQRPGITPTSLAVGVFALLLMGMLGQQSAVILEQAFALEHALAVPAILVFILISFAGLLVYAVTRYRLLGKGEALCLLYALLMAAPLMTQAFWHRIVSITATIPRAGDFDKMDALNDKLWPHGRNLIAETLAVASRDQIDTRGRVDWAELEYDRNQRAQLPVLINAETNDQAAVRIKVPLRRDDDPWLAPGEPYLVSVLLRPSDPGPTTYYYCRIYPDEATEYTEVFRESAPTKPTFMHPTGFQRVGAYGVRLPPGIRDYATVEFGLAGPGRLELADAKLFSVAALESAFTGKQQVSEREYAALPETERAGLVVKPDTLWSWRGIKYILGAYIPWRDWAQPLASWTTFFALILLATLCITVILRKQWAENERYPMPLTRIPLALLGLDDQTKPDARLPAIWKNPMMWIGFGTTLVWCLLRGWSFYNSKVPNLAIKVPLQPYFAGPEWGGMWDISFTVHAIYLSLALFMELNILLSLIVGYFLFRCQLRLGEMTGWNAHPDYPFHDRQMVAAYLTYGLVTLFFARKYLTKVARAALRGDREASADEIFSYRTALGVLVLTFIGAMAWGAWLKISPTAIALFFAYVVLTGLVTAKFRAECGAPWGYYSPQRAWLFLMLVGGFAVFGADGMMVCVIASFLLFETVFYLIPGAQLELAELGRRLGVTRRHLLYTCVLGVAGGILVGGWVFLSNAYALGGDTVKYQWAFQTKLWYFFQYTSGLNEATSQMAGQSTAAAPAGIQPQTYGYAVAALVTIALTVLRQIWAQFWFHPFGYLVSPTYMMYICWGSVLTAWIIRSLVLRVGGAATVKNKLIPFAIGMFLAGVCAYLIFGIHGSFLLSHNVERIFVEVP